MKFLENNIDEHEIYIQKNFLNLSSDFLNVIFSKEFSEFLTKFKKLHLEKSGLVEVEKQLKDLNINKENMEEFTMLVNAYNATNNTIDEITNLIIILKSYFLKDIDK